MKEEKFLHTRKSLRGRRLWVAEGGSFGATEESAATGVRRAKRRGSRTEDPVPTSTHQSEKLLWSPTGAGRGWELRLRLWSDPRERTGV